ncbi:Spy/CpxP family protein refolding chaperone [Pseudoalteromonas sp. S16_S37]|uniref:Spy/CpxP family protein refolding chaperone n=1 Tax=Pseudoalteromonas sp. S16_S37 TaxID=2720228 RepID=UPI001680F7E1|nr:Spy/CpxP family protein refolding chaperone [Pseudoalteromonas sp. S16_S37]MBD1581741.1 Spy/CpxP family protein refolding chaperone [Pseudoalteromonas sp. S16_S37]
MKAISVLIIGGSLLFSALSEAGQGRHHDEHFLLSDKAASTLNLSKEQQQKIADILEQKKAAMKGLKVMRHNHKDEFKELIEKDFFDEQQARSLIAKTSEAKNEALIAKLKSKQQLWQVLTPEQREKLEKIKHRKAHRHAK